MVDVVELETGSAVAGAAVGAGLSPEERTALECSLPVLQTKAKLSRVFFWGKVVGTGAVYLIAKGFLKQSLLASPSFFWSHEGIDWMQLVPVDEDTAKLCRDLRGRFSGDPAFAHEVEVAAADVPSAVAAATKKESASSGKPPAITVTAGDEDEDEEDEDEDEGEGEGGSSKAKAPAKVKVTLIEEKRLSVVVRDIDQATAIAPRGSLLLTAEHAVLPNPSFCGLSSIDEAKRLDAWLHVRQPVSVSKRGLLEQAGLAKTLDFLDTLSEDDPQAQWAVVPDASGTVTVRSLLWPGAVAFAIPGTRRHGHCYVGSGEKTLDLAFLL